ncbi:MAG: response regulator [Flavobacteriaceae bacterium]
MNYLFIDDDKLQLMKLKKALDPFSQIHEIKIMDNPLTAMELVRTRTFSPDVIVVDFNMPQMDGLDFIKELKFSGHSYIPIVISTTMNCVEMAKECYGNGAAGYLIKPTDYKEFTKKLKILIQYWEANLFPETSNC